MVSAVPDDIPVPAGTSAERAIGVPAFVRALQALAMLVHAVPLLAERIISRLPYSTDEVIVSVHLAALYRLRGHVRLPADGDPSGAQVEFPDAGRTPAGDVAHLAAALGASVSEDRPPAPGWFAGAGTARHVIRCTWVGMPSLVLELHALQDIEPAPPGSVPEVDSALWAAALRTHLGMSDQLLELATRRIDRDPADGTRAYVAGLAHLDPARAMETGAYAAERGATLAAALDALDVDDTSCECDAGAGLPHPYTVGTCPPVQALAEVDPGGPFGGVGLAVADLAADVDEPGGR